MKVTASLILRKIGGYPRQNNLAVALREFGRIERSIFTLHWIQDKGLRKKVMTGLNKGEAKNALAGAVFINRHGEIRDRSFDSQMYKASGLNLVVAAIILWNTVYLGRLGYNPLPDLERLIVQSNLQQEAYQKLVYKYVCNPVNPIYMDTTILTTYHMTHEIFALSNFGEFPPHPIITKNKAFFLEFFDKSIQWAMTINHIDLLGELIMCVKMLDLKDVPSLQRGIEYILSNQEDNGTFGITNPTLPNVYRHGILVAMMTLSMV